MACISDETKAKCAKVVIFISILLFLMAAIMIGYAAAAFGGVEEVGAGDYKTPFKFEQDSIAFVMCVLGGVLALGLSILGCCTYKFKNPLVTTPFVLCSFLIGILCMAVGGVVMSADIKDMACNKPLKMDFGNGEVEITGSKLAAESL